MRKSMVAAACAAAAGWCLVNGAASAASIKIPNFYFDGEAGFSGNIFGGKGEVRSPINRFFVDRTYAVLSKTNGLYEFTANIDIFEYYPPPDGCPEDPVACGIVYPIDSAYGIGIDVIFTPKDLSVHNGIFSVNVFDAIQNDAGGTAYADYDGVFNYNPIVHNYGLVDLSFSLAQVPLPSSLPLAAVTLVVLGALTRFKPASARPATRP